MTRRKTGVLTPYQHALLVWLSTRYTYSCEWVQRNGTRGFRPCEGPPETWTHFRIKATTGPRPPAADDTSVTPGVRLHMANHVGRVVQRVIPSADWTAILPYLDPGGSWRPRMVNLSDRGWRAVAAGPCSPWPRKLRRPKSEDLSHAA